MDEKSLTFTGKQEQRTSGSGGEKKKGKQTKRTNEQKKGETERREERNCPANRDRYTYFLPEIKYIQGHMLFGYIEIIFLKCSYFFFLNRSPYTMDRQ